MSARLQPRPWPPTLPPTVPMQAADVDAVLAVELRAYPFPWTHGNFIDSLASGYWTGLARWPADDGARCVLGYAVAMPGVDELHLLNLTIAPEAQGQGFGRALLGRVVQAAAACGAADLLLEVRESNLRARRLYAATGFETIGRRRAYYPALNGREDALVMRRPVSPTEAHDGLD